MRIALLLATLILIGASTGSAQNPASPSGASKLTGCLKHSASQYYLVEQNGTRHTLMAKGQHLGSYVNHQVTVTGKADTTHNPAAGSDTNGMGSGFFSVGSVSDQGDCKKKKS